jgi:hypothetical protein
MSGDSNLVIIVKAEAAGSAALRVVHEQYLIKLRHRVARINQGQKGSATYV